MCTVFVVPIESLLPTGYRSHGVIRRMRQRFPHQCSLAILSNDAALAKDTYIDAEALPSLTTQNRFKVSGYIANGPLFEGSTLTIVHNQQDLSKHILKCLDSSETRRLRVFQEKHLSHPHIVSFELHASKKKNKSYMMMPAFPSTLSQFPFLHPDNALRLLRDIGGAIDFLHSQGFAHCDIKPGNIAVSSLDGFVLIDLGS